jgi:glycosyltransferase involved in cell wall biosynthesis
MAWNEPTNGYTIGLIDMHNMAVGILTHNRPQSFERCLKSVLEFAPNDASIFINDDGSTEDYDDLFEFAESNGCIVFRSEKSNIATTKNKLIKEMMHYGADHLFLIEDDMEAVSTEAFNAYVDAFYETGVGHMMFAHHGNRNVMMAYDDILTYHFECVGSWCYYTRDSIETVGLMDENFENCWEHVVHSMLIGDSGLMQDAGWRMWPDVKDSDRYIKEIDVVSTHANKSEQDLMSEDRIQNGLLYWKSNYRFPADVEPLIQRRRK